MYSKRELIALEGDFRRSSILRKDRGMLIHYRCLLIICLADKKRGLIDLFKHISLRMPNILDKRVRSYNLNIFNYESTLGKSSDGRDIHNRGVECNNPRKGLIAYSDQMAENRWRLLGKLRNLHKKAGFKEMIFPSMVSRSDLINTGQLPKFEHELFGLNFKELYLSPTGEVQLGNLIQRTPMRYFTHTNCFRKELNYGKNSRGLRRTMEFEKTELFSYSWPERSEHEHRFMLLYVSGILRGMDIKHRVIMLSGLETGFSSRLTYDIEVYLPTEGYFMEISSISNCGDFQSRRVGNRSIRKDKGFLHTLNGSCLPIGRALITLASYDIKI